MLINIETLPLDVQAQILQAKQGATVEFAQDGELIATLSPAPHKKDSLTATAGILSEYGIDRLEYERTCRAQWDRLWGK